MSKTTEPKKTTLSLSALDLQSFEPTLALEKTSGAHGYVTWGGKNNYPKYLYDTYQNCGVLKSIIDGCADFTFGKGIVNETGIDTENQFGDTVSDIVDKIILDRWIFGGFALQVKYSKVTGQVISIAHMDVSKCRLSEDYKTVYVNDRWDKWGSNRYEPFHAFNPDTGREDGVQILFYRGHRTRGVYPTPDYVAALVSAEILIKVNHFHYDELHNNFMASGIVNFNNGVPTETEQKAVESRLVEKFTGVRNNGARNTARLLLSFNTDKDSATTFERLQSDDLDNRYNTLYQTAMSDVFISLRAQPHLFGLPAPTGFAEMNYDEAFDLLNETHISKKQKEIEKVFGRVFPSGGIRIIPLTKRETNEQSETTK